MSHPRKGFGLVLLGALALLVSSAPAASAAITQSTATVSAPFGFEDEVTPTDGRLVTATTDGTAGDTADVLCLYGTTDFKTLASGVTIGAGGAVSANVDESVIHDRYCRVIVVDGGSGRPADDAPFHGPWIGGGDWTISTAGDVLYDFYAEGGWKGSYADFHSIGRGGMYDMALRDELGVTGPELWYYNGYFRSGETHPDGNGGTRPDALVDGKHAYTAYEANDRFPGTPGSPTIAIEHSVDPTTGNITIHEAQDLAFCVPDETTCSSFVPSGLRVERMITTSNEGVVATFTDKVANTTAAEHSFDFEYQQFNKFSGATGFRFPGETGYSAHPVGDVKTGIAAASTVGISYDTTGANGVDNPLGAITFSPAPTRLLFGKDHAGTDAVASGFWIGFKDTVPAGGSRTITQNYVMGAAQAQVDAVTSAAEDSQGAPTVAITDPAADGSTVSAPNVTVRGTAADNKGIASFKVNGADVPVAGDGTWSTPLTLSLGANTITAVVTDNAGNAATATRAIAYTKPLPPPVARVTKNGKVKVTRKGKKILVDTGIKVTCPAGTTTCTAAVSAKTVKAVAAKVHKSKVTVAKKTFTIAAGKTKKIVLTLSTKGAKALKRNKKLTIKVTVVTKVGNGAAQTTSRTIKIKQPKKAAKKH